MTYYVNLFYKPFSNIIYSYVSDIEIIINVNLDIYVKKQELCKRN